MAFFIQYRALKKRVQQQLTDLDQTNHNQSPRLSGDTTRVDASPNTDKEKGHDPDFPYASLDGISVSETDDGSKFYLVSFENNDPQDPKNWSTKRRLATTYILTAIAFIVTCASSIDSAIAVEAAEDFHVSEVVETLGGTAIFLITFGIGSLFMAPLSEMLGRFPVYILALSVFGAWLIGAALAPNFASQIVFRGLAGFFACAPLTVAGGSMSDLWTTKERTWTFPIFAISGFGGPVLGPVIASYIGVTGVLSWRWTEWIMLIGDGLVLFFVVAFMRETMSPRLLLYKAKHLREITRDDRFKGPSEVAGHGIGKILKTNFTRPFILALEPIVLAYTLYLTVVYIILFTFLDGYPDIFGKTYGINQGLTNLCFLGLLVGILCSMVLVPVVVKITNRQLERDGDDGSGSKLNQETRTIFSMIGAPLIPIGLFWMGWTDYASISIWSPLAASVLIGFGIVCIFMSAYMYVIDSYEALAASALTFVALVRYLAAGGMTVVGVPMYKNLGTHYTLTVLGCISAVIVPIPYILYIHGGKLRQKSKYAASK